MIKKFFYKLKGLFKFSEKENIKEVLEDLNKPFNLLKKLLIIW